MPPIYLPPENAVSSGGSISSSELPGANMIRWMLFAFTLLVAAVAIPNPGLPIVAFAMFSMFLFANVAATNNHRLAFSYRAVCKIQMVLVMALAFATAGTGTVYGREVHQGGVPPRVPVAAPTPPIIVYKPAPPKVLPPVPPGTYPPTAPNVCEINNTLGSQVQYHVAQFIIPGSAIARSTWPVTFQEHLKWTYSVITDLVNWLQPCNPTYQIPDSWKTTRCGIPDQDWDIYAGGLSFLAAYFYIPDAVHLIDLSDSDSLSDNYRNDLLQRALIQQSSLQACLVPNEP
jgi:hypothetical protein